MNKSGAFALGLAVLLGTRLGQAQATEGSVPAPAKPTTGAAAADAPAEDPPAPAQAEVKDLTPAPAAGTTTRPGATTSAESSAVKQRAIKLQQRRIEELSARIEATEAAAKQAPPASAEERKAKAAVEEDRAKRSAAATTLAVLEGAKVSPETAKSALAIEQQEHAALKAKPGAAAVADAEASEASLNALERAATPTPDQPDKNLREVELPKGDLLHYGPTVSVLRVSALRNPGEPGRYRNYEGRYEFVPAEFGFQFLFAPHNPPWRHPLANGKNFQLLSAGGMLLARIDKDDVERGNLSIAATLSFFQEIIGLGVGVDLYRGVPVQGADGQSGSDTAFTGLLAWSLMRRGEVTPENVFFVVSLGLDPLVRSVTGEL